MLGLFISLTISAQCQVNAWRGIKHLEIVCAYWLVMCAIKESLI